MPDPPAAYVVRDEPTGTGPHPDAVHPYTLRGLLAALDDARIRSFGDVAQEVIIIREDGRSRVIRRFEHGAEVS
jgi:hypothetical protein